MRPWCAVAALALIGLLAACSSEASNTQTLGSTTYNSHGTKSAQGKPSLEIEADSFYFKPTFVRGDPGKTLQLELKNDSGIQHNFSITSQRIDSDIQPKGSVTVMVTLPSSGVVAFFCKFHTGRGMNGQVLAGDAQPQAVTGGPAPAITPKSGSPTRPGY
jgi:plastocyanin